MYTYTTAKHVLAYISAIAFVGVFAAVLPLTAHAQEGPSCELDIALVLDSSGSIAPSDLSSMQDSFDSFVDSILAAEPNTEMTVVDFDVSASIEQDWTNVAADIKDGIDNGVSGGATNWEDAINTAQGQFPHRTANNPDVMIFASDGNPNEPGDDANALSVAQTAADNAKAAGTYIKAIGIGDSIDGANLDSISSDGSHIESDFDQLETDLLALANTLCDEVIDDEGGGDDTVVNNNSATVTNVTGAEAKTGGNDAGGSTGGDGGDGGDVTNDGDNQNVSGSGTGSGGNGGTGGTGGTILTGNALAEAGTVNVVNTNTTRIDRCACNGDDGGDTLVRNRNHAVVFNGTFARAKTGHNDADGSEGGAGGNGGDLENNDAGREEASNQNVNDSTTGDGGRGGSSADGGLVQTGDATARAETRTVVNRNLTRILR